MTDLPKRLLLKDQAAERLREGIRIGEWSGYLPSEVELSRRLQIGRNTVRKALAQLSREGWIDAGRSGRRRSILRKPTAPATGTILDAPVIFLTPFPPDRLSPMTLKQVDELHPMLMDAGSRMWVMSSKAFHIKTPARTLAKLIEGHPAAGWILHQSPRPVQEWFQRRRLPTCILGVAHEGIELPSVTPDLEATARHAAGVLKGRGHRRIALLRPVKGLAGSELVMKGFLDAFDRGGEGEPVVMEAEVSVDGTVRALGRLFRNHPPSAIVIEPVAVIPTVITWLGRQGLRCPEDVSVVALFDDPSLEYLLPDLARYHVDIRLEIRRLVQQLRACLEQGMRGAEPLRLMPEFHPGNSVASIK